jgi:hypothetical protein
MPAGLDIPATEIAAVAGTWRLGVISNPLSGGNRRGRIREVYRCLQNYPGIPHREVRTLSDLRAALDELAARGVNILAVNSGDGTVQATLTMLSNRRPFARPPLLALVGGGTTNMTHHDLGLPGDHVRALGRLLNWACHGDGDARVRRRTLLRVDRPDRPAPIYGLFFGAAGIFKAIQFFHSSIHRRGLSGDAAHLLILARFIWGLLRRHDALVAPVSAAIRTECMAVPRRDYLMLLVTTLDRLVLGLRPFWVEGSGPLRVAAVAARPRGLLKAIPALTRGRATPHACLENGYLSCNARDIHLHLSGGFTLDGELFAVDPRLGPVRVQAGGTADFLRV